MSACVMWAGSLVRRPRREARLQPPVLPPGRVEGLGGTTSVAPRAAWPAPCVARGGCASPREEKDPAFIPCPSAALPASRHSHCCPPCLRPCWWPLPVHLSRGVLMLLLWESLLLLLLRPHRVVWWLLLCMRL